MATDATPDEVRGIFPQGQLVGQKFGVVIVDGIDVATFRKDGVYSDGRRPDSVVFTKTPQEDAARRDFTVNALFMDPWTGDILDFFGGQEDLKNKLIRAVGNAHDRFTQDHLRILRADRFAGRYGFAIHPDTEAAMTATSHHLAGIDVERITQELEKSLAYNAFQVVNSMKKTGSLAQVLPEVENESQIDFAATLKVLAQVGPSVSTEFAFCALLFKLTPKTVLGITSRLKFTNELRDHIIDVLTLQNRIMNATQHTSMDILKKLMRDKYFPDALKLFGMRVHAGDLSEYAPSYHFLFTLYDSMSHEDLHPTRFVTGDDLISWGYKPGKIFKSVLDSLESKQLTGEIRSREQAVAFVHSAFKA